jgi:hypothetical protein
MTVKKSPHPLKRVCINLREGDWEWLQENHEQLGAGKVVRELVINYIESSKRRIEEKAAQLQLNLGDIAS